MSRTKVFISYSHFDDKWRKRLLEQLNVLERFGYIELWDDQKIGAGEDWLTAINEHLSRARIAVLLISPSFLDSDFILNQEIPSLFERHKTDGMIIFPLLIRDCPWKVVSWLSQLQMRPRNARPVASFQGHRRDQVLAEQAQEIAFLGAR